MTIKNHFSPGPASRYPNRGGKRLTRPDGEVVSLGEIVAMHMRGQDISLYVRNVNYEFKDEDHVTHDRLSFHSVSNMDFVDRHEVIQQHQQDVDALKSEHANQLTLQAEADAKALELAKAQKEESEKPPVSRSKKYSKNTDANNDE